MSPDVKTSRVLLRLCGLIVLLTLVASSVGLFWLGGDGPFTFETVYGDTVEIYGRGLYASDWAFKAPILRGADAIMLFICVPLLVVAVILYARGSLRGHILLVGMLCCFLYNAASVALGAAYNVFFLIYVVLFSASLYAFVLAFWSVDLPGLAAGVSSRLPHGLLATFVFIAGLSPAVWLIDIVASLVGGHAPANVASYTTDVTTVIDLGVITPAAFLGSALLRRRKPLGYLLAPTILILLVLIGLIVASQSVLQMVDGIVLSVGEVAAFVAPFISLSLIAVGLTAVFLRNITEPDLRGRSR